MTKERKEIPKIGPRLQRIWKPKVKPLSPQQPVIPPTLPSTENQHESIVEAVESFNIQDSLEGVSQAPSPLSAPSLQQPLHISQSSKKEKKQPYRRKNIWKAVKKSAIESFCRQLIWKEVVKFKYPPDEKPSASGPPQVPKSVRILPPRVPKSVRKHPPPAAHDSYRTGSIVPTKSEKKRPDYYRVSTRRITAETGMKDFQYWLQEEKHLRPEIFRAEEKLKNLKYGPDKDKFLEDIVVRNKISKELAEFYGQPVFRKKAFKRYKLWQKFEGKVVSEIETKFGKDAFFGYGCWNRKTPMKGFAPAPLSKWRKLLHRHFNVVDVPVCVFFCFPFISFQEWNTSRTCIACDNTLQKCKRWNERKGKNTQVRGLLWCDSCRTYFSRDYVGAINIARNLDYRMENDNWHPLFRVNIIIYFIDFI
jgi:hypothetical protein